MTNPTLGETATVKFACDPPTGTHNRCSSISAYAWMRQAEFRRFPKFFLRVFTDRPPLRATSASRLRSILAKPFGVFTFPPSRPSTTAAGFFFFAVFSGISWRLNGF